MLSNSNTATSSAAVLQPHLVFPYRDEVELPNDLNFYLLLFSAPTVINKQGLELGSLADAVKIYSFLNRLLEMVIFQDNTSRAILTCILYEDKGQLR